MLRPQSLTIDNMASFVASCLQAMGLYLPYIQVQVPTLDGNAIVDASQARLQDCGDAALYCPHTAQVGVL